MKRLGVLGLEKRKSTYHFRFCQDQKIMRNRETETCARRKQTSSRHERSGVGQGHGLEFITTETNVCSNS